MSRLVDPVHFFSARGISVLTQEHQDAEMNRLRTENNELKRKLKAMTLRLRVLAGDVDQNSPGN